MPSSAFTRLSSLALVIGGLLATVAMIFHRPDLGDPLNVPVHLALYTGVMVALLGLPGLGAKLATRSPRLGLAGATALFLGLAFEDPIHSVLTFTAIPVIASDPATRPLLDGPPPGLMGPIQMLAIPVLFAGLILLAIAIWRTGVLPRWLVIPLIGTVLLIPLAFADTPFGIVGPVLLYLSLVALGWTFDRTETESLDFTLRERESVTAR